MKSFLEVFPTLQMEHISRALLEHIQVEKVSANKEGSKMRIYVSSDILVEKRIIFDLEGIIKRQIFPTKKIQIKILENFRLSEQYTPKNLYDAYKESILLELREYSIAQYLILKKAEVVFVGERIMEFSVERTQLSEAIVPEFIRIVEKIFFERCGVDCELRPHYIAHIERKIQSKDENSRENGGDQVIKEKLENGVDQEKRTEISEKKTAKSSGKKKEYISRSKNPDVLFGRDFEDQFVPLSQVEGEMGEIVVHGKIVELDERFFERSGKTMFIFSLTDFTDSIQVKIFAKEEDVPVLHAALVKGNFIKLKGTTNIDKFDSELIISFVRGIKKSDAFGQNIRTDDAQVKRVELHCHTKMSDFDGVSSAAEIIKQAADWGMEAIAITDHGNVQGFTDAYHAVQKMKNPPKIIYGVEGYLVDDLKEVVVNPKEVSLDDGFVVFDIETTGFSPTQNRIIEIGAVKIVEGKIVDRFSTFINPQIPIPFQIEELTSINDSMVVDAPLIEEVLPKFLAFCEDFAVVAHNAGFDTRFIATNAKRIGYTYDPTIVDTVTLARILLPQLGRFKLDTVAKALDVSLENHHRAVDDAECTAEIFLKLAQMLRERNILLLKDVEGLAKVSQERIKKMNTNHIIILAKNEIGRINLYKLISYSHLNYYAKRPRIPKSVLQKYREGLIIGSACEAGELFRAILDGQEEEDIRKIAEFYDYLEIQPIGNNEFMIASDRYAIESREDIQKINKKIVELAKSLNKPVVGTCDVHFLNPEDEIYRRIILAGKGFTDADHQPPLYLRTTNEMIEEFHYLGPEDAYAVAVTNSRMIADMVEDFPPVRPDKCPPVIENSDELLTQSCYAKAHEQYGENLPEIVTARLEKELNSIIKNGFAVMYIIAKKLVEKSNEDGYLVGSRGSVGSSFAAYTSGITEVNPLPPHYYCDCKYVDFDSEEVKQFAGMAGCDMPDKICPKCGKKLKKDGFDIPFETFLGFKGDKEPDIDLNFSGEYQPKAHDYTEVIFGQGHTFRAGTVGTLAEKTAYGYVKKYFDEHGQVKRKCEINRITQGCVGVRRTTGQHPGGIIVLPHGEEIYTFTPVQHPANDMTTKIITTHFDYHAIDHNLLKLDILGHQDPTMIRMLQDLIGIDPVKDIPLDSRETMTLFQNTDALGVKPEDLMGCKLGALGIPEFGTDFAMQMLIDAKPKGLSDLVRISGLSHGTDVWLGNAQTLIQEGKATIRTAICTRDDIMIYLIGQGMEEGESFKIMESVRKGKGLSPEYEQDMIAADVPKWYIESCKKIKYMFPKAHAAAYVMMAWRIAYCKIYYPLEYYTAYFSIRATGFSYELMCFGKEKVERAYMEIKNKSDATAKEEDTARDLRIAQEMYARGYEFEPIDIYKAQAVRFQVTENKKIMPALTSIDGLGESVARQIVEAAARGEFISKDDFMNRAKVNKTICEQMDKLGLLGNLPQSDQISIFDII